MAGRNEVVDVAVQVHHTTDRAILVSDDGDRAKAVWLPLSMVEVETHARTSTAVVTMPEWLALEKKLI